MNMKNYTNSYNANSTPQNQPIPGKDMVKNVSGGFVFAVDDWTRLNRFLILGTEGSSIHQTKQKLTRDSAKAVLRAIQADGLRAVREIVQVSTDGRAPKNDPAIFALAMALKLGDENTRRAASEAVPLVCRTGTHIFQFAEAVKAFGGWGRVTARAFANWYNQKSPDDLAHAVLKYQSREGWSHRDLLRQSHAGAGAPSKQHAAIYSYVVRDGDLSARKVERKVNGKVVSVGEYEGLSRSFLPRLFEGVERVKEKGLSDKQVAKLIAEYDLPREVVPTEYLNSVAVWDALLHAGKFGMPVTAMIRNLGKMTSIGLLAPMSDASRFVVSKLTDVNAIKHGRVHPLTTLIANRQYAKGRGDKGSLTWTPDQNVMRALDDAFYLGFKAVEPTNKRYLLAVDVSGSMHSSNVCDNNLTSAEAAAVMALVTANTEPTTHIVGFTDGGWSVNGKSRWNGYGSGITPLAISPKMRLKDVTDYTRSLPFGGTDCTLPMQYALANKIPVDVFVVLTDNETWANPAMHPVQALQKYRKEMGIPAKMVVQAFEPNNFTIADPNDAGMLDIAGLDAGSPEIIASFVRG